MSAESFDSVGAIYQEIEFLGEFQQETRVNGSHVTPQQNPHSAPTPLESKSPFNPPTTTRLTSI